MPECTDQQHAQVGTVNDPLLPGITSRQHPAGIIIRPRRGCDGVTDQ